MFQPFRFSFWLRMAVLGFFTAEITGGSGFHGNLPSRTPSGGAGHGPRAPHPFPFHWAWLTPAHIIELGIGIAVCAFVFSLIFIYISSVLRFVLFNAVLHGDAQITPGWRRWRDTGRQFFLFQLLLLLVGWALLVLFVGVPLMMLFTHNHIGFWFIDARGVATLIFGMLSLMACGLILALLTVLAKDFVVPMMALENIGWQEGFRRFRIIARGHASEYFVYVLMKILLRIAAGIGHGIILFIIGMVLAIPVIIVVAIGVAIGAGAALAVKAMLITIGIVGALILLAIFVALSAVVGAPIAFFFPSYAIYFFAGRYEPLGRIVFPAPPQPPPPPPVVVPEPPPMPA
jgi:hypothetical protein